MLRQRETRNRRGGLRLAALGLVAAAVAGSAWIWLQRREQARLEGLLAEARADVAAGRVHSGLEKLRALAEARPDWNEVDYLVGLCEQARGRSDAAVSAWERVAEDGPFGTRAALELARTEMKQGRLGAAERRLTRFVEPPREQCEELRRTLATLLKLQDRRHELSRLLRDEVGQPPMRPTSLDPAAAQRVVDVIRELWEAEHAPFPIAAVRSYFEEMRRLAPRDDRVRLGLACLDARAGRFDAAERSIASCLEEHPDDPVLWRLRLDWARSARRHDVARRCLDRVPLAQFGDDDEAAAEIKRWEAWIAAAQHDADQEHAALSVLAALEPANLPALERLAELDARAGRGQAASQWRRLKDQRDRDRSSYAALLRTDDPTAHAEDLTRLADSLGRRFDAAWWSTLANAPRGRPKRPAASLRPPQDATLAQMLPDLPNPPSRRDDAATADDGPAPRFVDDAARAGLAFTFDPGRSPQRQLPETMSGGVGLIDYDGDGWLDVYAVQGGAFPRDESEPPAGAARGDRLFRNQRDGTFLDVTERAGVASTAGARDYGYGHGVAVGDVDNDGRADLFLTRWRAYRLLRNRGDGAFEDATESWGLGGDRDWPTSAALADFDNDGDLDLYVCHYLAWDDRAPRLSIRPETGEPFYATPAEFPALGDRLYRNDGGRFVEIGEAAGVRAADVGGRGLGVVAADLDDDGWIDLYVANDMSSNYFFRNLGRRGAIAFEEVALERGAATSSGGGALAGMGVACGDFDGDARPDLFVTNFLGESTTYYQNLGGGVFADRSAAVGLTAPTRDLLGFGLALLDADDDGRLDLLSANGHVNDGRPQFPWMMPPQLLRQGRDGRLVDSGDRAGDPFAAPRLGRGLASGDLDNDGRVDALLVAQGEPLVYLHNQTPRAGRHALTLRLQGATSNRDGVGARVTVSRGPAGRERRCATVWRLGGGSYLSASDPRLHIGLGADAQPVVVEVRWPSGQSSRFENLAVDAAYRIVEGEAAPHPEGSRPTP